MQNIKFLSDNYSIPINKLLSGSVLRIKKDNSPLQTILIDKNLYSNLKDIIINSENSLNSDEIIRILLHTSNYISHDFSPTSINLINRLYYSCDFAFEKQSGLADMYIRNKVINQSFGRLINYFFHNQKKLKIKELSSGSKPDKWKYILPEINNPDIDITLSDFDTIALPGNNFSFDTHKSVNLFLEKYSLFEELQNIKDTEKLDVFLITYGFDSVWQDEDIRYTKYNKKWYRTVYRIKVKDDFDRKLEMLEALKTGTPYKNIQAKDFDSIFIEVLLDEISEFNQVQFSKYIIDEYKDDENISFGFPGGMIKRVTEAFENQLDKNGVFIIGDVGRFDISNKYGIHTKLDYSESGFGAKYKEEDYYLGKKILEEEFGFKVDIFSLEDLVEDFIGLEWKNSATKGEVYEIVGNPNNFVMVVRK